ncbi:MAG: ABC transporter permease [Bacilli bacterium]|nr:ABC transporter permease [Bacilli bacterium]
MIRTLRNKSNLLIIFCITISSILLISIGILFSSFRQYLINKVESEIGSYHVIIKGEKITNNFILKNDYKNERNYIRFKEVKRVYKNVDYICKRSKCLNITYNDSLLSLYGVSHNKNVLNIFKSFLYFFVCFFGIIVFIIIYNSFSITIGIRKKEIILYKLVSADNKYLYKLYFKESLIMGIIGILLGFLISIFLNLLLIKIINSLLYEIFSGKLNISFYYSFIIIPVLFLFLIIFLCSIFPFKKIKKYKALELFRDSNQVNCEEICLNNNIVYYLFKVSINRFKSRYRNLVICIFIFCFSFNVIFLVLKYGLKCINDYVIIPSYDLSISVKGDYDFKNIVKDFGSIKKNEFHSCLVNINIPKEYFKEDYKKSSNVIITNLGENKVINSYDDSFRNDKISHISYNRFKKFDKLVIDDIKISDLKLTNKKYFGIDGDDTVINLENEEFKKVCNLYNSNLIIKTNYKGIDNYLDNLIRKEKINMSYLNVKKTKEIISNLVLVFKILFYGVSILIFICLISVCINVSFFSIYERKREISSYRSLGLSFKDLIIVIFLECIYVSLKGFLISVPFTFIVNKYLYISLKRVFDFNGIIVGNISLLMSFILSFFIFFIFMIIVLRFISQKSLISNIKYNY